MDANSEETQQVACVDDRQEAQVVTTNQNHDSIGLYQDDKRVFLANSASALDGQVLDMNEIWLIQNRNHGTWSQKLKSAVSFDCLHTNKIPVEDNLNGSIDFLQSTISQNLASPSTQQPFFSGTGLNVGGEYSFVPSTDHLQPEYPLGFEGSIFDHLSSNFYRFPDTPSLFSHSHMENQYAQYGEYSTLSGNVYPQMLESQAYAPNLEQSQSDVYLPYISAQECDGLNAGLLQGPANCEFTDMTPNDDFESMWNLDVLPNQSNMTKLLASWYLHTVP